MSKEDRNPKFKWNAYRSCLTASDFEIRASFVIGHSSFGFHPAAKADASIVSSVSKRRLSRPTG